MDETSPEFEPSLGYNGTSGHQTADTSRDGVRHADATGITNIAQRYVLALAAQGGRDGTTVVEARENDTSLHHGRISAALTNLHKAGRLAALKDRRQHSGIYVLPEYVEGREVREFRSNRPHIDRDELVALVDHHRMVIDRGTTGWRCRAEDWRGPDLPAYRIHLADVIIAEFGR